MIQYKIMSEVDLGTETILNEPVRDVLERWERVVNASHSSNIPLSSFWIGGPEDRTAPVIESFAGELGIANDGIIKLDIDQSYQRKVALQDDLLRLEDRILSSGSGKVLVVAKGFENVVGNMTDYILARAGHRWDQENLSSLKGSKWSRFHDRVSGANKHVVVITTIGFSCGDTAYKEAMGSAASSQFYNGLLEL